MFLTPRRSNRPQSDSLPAREWMQESSVVLSLRS